MRRFPRAAWPILAGCGLVIGYGVFGRRAASRPSMRQGSGHEAAVAAPSNAEQQITASRSSSMAKPASGSGLFRRQPPDPYWQDPSVDPDILARAFARPPRSLPPEARPEASAIEPSEREWRRLQREDKAVAY